MLAAGAVYVGAAGLALIWLREDAAAGRTNVLFLMLVVWASDIGAYAVGRLFGGPKLAPLISPGKTWAGAAGGLAAAVAAGLAVALWAPGAAGRHRAGRGGARSGIASGGPAGERHQTPIWSEGHGAADPRATAGCSTGSTACWPRPRPQRLLAVVLGRGVHLWR